MADTDILKLTIEELAPKIKERKISPVDVVDASLAQAERMQPILNSFITILGDRARQRARELEDSLMKGNYLGPLHGIPIGIKDNLATAGIRTTVGSVALSGYVPDENAHVVTLCEQAGAVVIGKENLEEFAAGVTSNNLHYGAVHNPWGLDYVPGGSSGGGGANVAAGVTFASLGTDLGGSVRLPGTFCGLVGLKQTFGRVSQRGLLVTSFNGDHIGPMTRSVADSALMLQTLAVHDPLDPSSIPVISSDYISDMRGGLQGLKMGIPSNFHFDQVDPEVEVSVRAAISALQNLGVASKDVSIPTLEYAAAIRSVAIADSFVAHEPYLKTHRKDYGPTVLYRILGGQYIRAVDYSKALKAQRLLKEDHVRTLQQVDFIVTPTAPVVAPRIDSDTFTLGGQNFPVRGPGSGEISRNTSVHNATGLPAITVPCGFNSEGLPIGLQIIGRAFEESLIFRVAYEYEKVSGLRGIFPEVAGLSS